MPSSEKPQGEDLADDEQEDPNGGDPVGGVHVVLPLSLSFLETSTVVLWQGPVLGASTGPCQ
jgi:hypothetical protein